MKRNKNTSRIQTVRRHGSLYNQNRGNRGGVPGAEGLDDTKIGLGTGTTVTTNKDAKKLEEATEKVKEHGGAHRINGDN